MQQNPAVEADIISAGILSISDIKRNSYPLIPNNSSKIDFECSMPRSRTNSPTLLSTIENRAHFFIEYRLRTSSDCGDSALCTTFADSTSIDINSNTGIKAGSHVHFNHNKISLSSQVINQGIHYTIHQLNVKHLNESIT